MRDASRRALRAVAVVGGGSLAAVAVGIVRTKIAALMIGPIGIGSIGLLTTILTTASSVAAMGLGRAGVREVADAVRQGQEPGAIAGRAVLSAAWFLGLCGAILFLLVGGAVGGRVLHAVPGAASLPWLAPGVLFSVLAIGQGAVLGGRRELGVIARAGVVSALVGSIIGLLCLAAGGARGAAGYVVAIPLATALVGAYFLTRHRPVATEPAMPALARHWRSMVHVGPPFMAAGLATLVAQLLVQIIVELRLGGVALGHFQAAWSISTTYLGLLLASLAADFYPRLVSAMPDEGRVDGMFNDQVEVLLMLAGPILLALLAISSWVLRLLYSSDFAAASSMLRWQMLGDVLKLASWPLGFVLLASGAGRRFLLAEAVAMTVFVLAAWALVQSQGLRGVGQAFLLMYLVYLPLSFRLARASVALHWRVGVVVRLGALMLAALIVALLAPAAVGVWVGFSLSAAFALDALLRLGWRRGGLLRRRGKRRDG